MMTAIRFNRTTIGLTLLTVLLAYGTAVQAALEMVEDAYELNPEQILRWPLNTGDSLVVKPCDDCSTTVLHTTANTRYATGFDAPSISLRELLKEKSRTSDTANDLIIIFFRPDDRQITRIILQTEF